MASDFIELALSNFQNFGEYFIYLKLCAIPPLFKAGEKITKTIYGGIKINKAFKRNRYAEGMVDFDRIIIPSEIKVKYDDVDFSKIKYSVPFMEKYKEIVKNFVAKLKEEVPEECLQNMYNNINEVTINSNVGRTIEMMLKGFGGLYVYDNNRIDASSTRVMTHELLHMASTNNEDGITKIGFSNGSYGDGLNEGYTEWLNARYFNNKPQAYDMLADLAGKIEGIIGKDKMTERYFKADLKGLIEDVSEFSSPNRFFILINELEYFYDTSAVDLTTLKKDKKVMNKLESIYITLLDTKIDKLRSMISDNEIDELQAKELFDEYYKTFDFSQFNFDIELSTNKKMSMVDYINECVDFYYEACIGTPPNRGSR